MRQLTVLSVAYPFAPVGPDAVGGSEQVLSALDHALVAAGHRSLVVACHGSQIAGDHYSFPAPPPDRAIDEECGEHRRYDVHCRMAEALAENDVDIIHMHGLNYQETMPQAGPPMLATLHLPPEWYPPHGLAPHRPNSFVHCVSESQARSLPPGPHVLPPIPNGVAVDKLGAVRPRKCGYALMLARVCPEKGLHLALEAAHAANVSLLIGGAIFPYEAHQTYFHEKVAPLLDRRRRYLGPVAFPQKRRLLAAARCLLVPSLVAETSSLVAMEAASAGTPVVAFRSGALPEVVEDGRTGYLVDDAAGMAAAIRQVGAIEPETCRAVARSRFSLERMTERYFERYAMLAGREARAAA